MHLLISNQSLNSFGDLVLLRDPRGRSMYRSLHPVQGQEGPGFAVTGSFSLHQVFAVEKEEGIAFVDATGDANPIHRQGDVVSGAMTAARAVAGLEALFPALGVTRLNIKFRAVAAYGRRMRQQLALSFRGYEGFEARLRIEQEGRDVAEGVIAGKIGGEILRPNVGKWRVNKDELKRVEQFFRALKIAPELYLRAGGEPNFGYPRAFLASLPSGEMVRRLSGEGGFLTNLDLTFPEGVAPGITGAGLPEVGLKPAKARPSFAKVLTWIKSGVEEYCKGFALVFRPDVREPAGSAAG
ncbi:MAG TPA: hypothetical protein DCM87_17990 [Planctomycetes bacterium]|nr:hypothetical protein [Planctomycetota bacterium]